jgi:hypothetical protein
LAGPSNLVDLIVGLAWPGVAAFAVWSFRQPLTRLIDRLKSASYDKGKIALEMHEALDRSAEEAQLSPQRAQAPTSAELARSEMIAKAAPDPDAVRSAMEELANEYDAIRRFNLPGSTRTAKMEGVVAKMRTLAQAAFALRHRFADSDQPGRRLAAVAMLGVVPDLDMLDWLGERVLVEKPFIAYHALVALLAATRVPGADPAQRAKIAKVATALRSAASFANDTDRGGLLARLVAETASQGTP